jgi:hypothetical protein
MTSISLHLGLNHVSRAAYNGWDGELEGCIPDAMAMSKMASARGWTVREVLTDEQATNEALVSYIDEIARQLVRGDRFLLSYSGHGGQVPDTSGDEDDKRDETWCLFDGEMIDDKVQTLMSKFKAGVKVIVVSDSCHSGTVTRAPRAPRGSRKPQTVAPMREPEIDIVKASCILFSGCTDDQLSGDLAEGGRFTVTMLSQLESLPPKAGWRTLEAEVRRRMPWDQRPGLYFSGKLSYGFINEVPFKA